jgi:hypothetical protein
VAERSNGQTGSVCVASVPDALLMGEENIFMLIKDGVRRNSSSARKLSCYSNVVRCHLSGERAV